VTRRPHVVVVSPTASMGGAERSMLELMRRTSATLRFTILLPEDGPLTAAAVATGAEVSLLAWPSAVRRLGERAGGGPRLGRLVRAAASLPTLVRRLRRRLGALAPDVVVSNGIKAHALAAVARTPGAALVWYGREGLEGRTLSARLLRLLGPRCDASIAISRYVASEMRRVLPARVPIRVLPNVIDLETFRPGLPPPPDLRKGDGTVWFGVVGALTPVKGQDVFLDAAAMLVRTVPGARFVLVGGTPYRTEVDLDFARALRERADRLGLAPYVTFLGERDDVGRIVGNLDVLVQPNRGPEGLGRAVLEAMACGTPVIAVDRWGPAESVQDGMTGLLVPPGDAGALAAAMERLATDGGLRLRLGRAGHVWAGEHLRSERIADGFVDAIRPLVAS